MTSLRLGTIALALLAGAGLAAAQTPGGQPPTQSPSQTPSQPPGGTLDHLPGNPLSPPPSFANQVQLTPTQKTAIFDAIKKDAGRVNPPTSFPATIGASVPPAIELYTLPTTALALVPEARILKYTMVEKQVVLVDPTTMRVTDIIRQ